MKFTDRVTIAGTKKRADGSLLVDARIARTGIQLYAGHEVGKPDQQIIRVYRPGSEVFSDETLQSVAHRPITNDHPDELVTSKNWKEHAVGQTGDEIKGEGIYIRVPLMVSDGTTIEDIEGGKRELSAGYTCTLDFAPGKTEAGEAYDAIQRNIRVNHVAVVRNGRAGSEVRIGDDAHEWGAAPILPTTDKESKMTDLLRTVVVDGFSVQTTDQGATAIAKLQKDLESSAARIAALTSDHAKALADKDEVIGTLKADLKTAQDAAPKPEDLDKLVADRTALVTTIKAIDAKIEVSGKSAAELRKAAVTAKYGADMVKDASDAEITGMFKAIAKDVKPVDTFRDGVRTGIRPTGDAAQAQVEAWNKSVTDLNDWRKEA